MPSNGRPWSDVEPEIAATWDALFADADVLAGFRSINKEAREHWRDKDSEPARTSFRSYCTMLALYRRERALPKPKEYGLVANRIRTPTRGLRTALERWPQHFPPLGATVVDDALRALAALEREVATLAPHGLVMPGRLRDGSLTYRVERARRGAMESGHPELAAAGRWAIDHCRICWDIPDAETEFVELVERVFDHLVAPFDRRTGRNRIEPHGCGEELRRMVRDRKITGWRYSDQEQAAFKGKGRAKRPKP